MKVRNGFVTNSSSTNDIFQALGTAGAAAALGTIINVIQPSENVEIVSYALLETLHQPEAPRPPEVRVNDSEYVVWYYAAVRMIDVQYATDEKTGEVQIDVLRDEYDDTYTSQIDYGIPPDMIERWLTFGTGGSGENASNYAIMDSGYKVCGFICESPENDKPRRHRTTPSSMMSFNISVTIGEHLLSNYKQLIIKDEADLYATSGFALNDSSVTTRLPLKLINRDKYEWKIDLAIANSKIEEYCRVELQEDKETTSQNLLGYELLVRPTGKDLDTKEDPVHEIRTRIDITGKPSSKHIADVWDYLELTLVNEGVVFEGKKDTDGNLIVASYVEESSETEDAAMEVPPTEFKLSCVVRTDEGETGNTAKFIDIWEAEVVLDALKGTDTATENLVKAYRYEVVPEGSTGRYLFKPGMQLPNSKSPYIVLLPVKCTYEGETYTRDIPVQLMGEPYGTKQVWEEEYRKLRIIIRRYIPPEQWTDILEHVNTNKNKLSVEQLRLMRRSIFETARDKLVAEAQGYETIASVCEWTEWGLEGAKWLGDQAFSYLMALYTGPVGEALIVPIKDVLTMVIADELAEYIWNDQGAYSEEQINKGVLGGIFTAFENAINLGSDDMVGAKSLSIKQLGRYLAAFAVVKCLNHYYCDTKPDGSPVGLWDAIIDTCKDLTTNIFKNLVSKKFESWMKSEKATEIFGKYMTQHFREYLTAKIPDWDTKGLEIASKYFSEFAGFVYSSAYGKEIEVAGSTEILSDPNDTIITFNLSSDPDKPWVVKLSLNRAKESLFDYMFTAVFGSFPFASTPVQTTNDPIYYR